MALRPVRTDVPCASRTDSEKARRLPAGAAQVPWHIVPAREKVGRPPVCTGRIRGTSSRLWREQGYRPSARRGFTAHRPGLGERRCFQKQKTDNRRTWSRLGRERRAQGPALGERVRRAIRSTCGNVGSRASRKPSFSPKAGRCAQMREIRRPKRRFSPEPGQCSRHCPG